MHTKLCVYTQFKTKGTLYLKIPICRQCLSMCHCVVEKEIKIKILLKKKNQNIYYDISILVMCIAVPELMLD